MNNQTLTNSMATEAKELSDLLARKKTNEPKSERLPYSHNRIIFGAPGTGKSHKLETESAAFITQTPTQLDLFNIHLNNCKVNGDYIKFGMLHSADLKDLTVQEISEKFSHKGAYFIKKGAVLSHLTTISAEELPQEVEDSIKAIPHGKKESKGLEIGYNYCYCLEGATKESLMSDYQAEPVVADWILYGVEAATSKIDKITETQISFMERVTFHPNYSYAQFVGTYKPKSELVEIDGKIQKVLSYEFVPGPFMRVYVNAINNPDKNFLLLIEEINRANVAAVFGDVFQLLDRDKNGVSEYEIQTSEDVRKFLANTLGGDGSEEKYKSLKLPNNMYIWATMNSADQGVFPMDTAFKRRWEFEYIDINENADKLVYKDNKPILIPIPIGNKAESKEKEKLNYNLYTWNDIREKINEKLSAIPSVNEDKLLGPFFFSLEKLRSAKDDPQEFIGLFKSKVLMYLFEDVVKISPTKLFEKCGDHPRYSTICSKFDEIGCGIFGFELEKQNPSETEPSETPNE